MESGNKLRESSQAKAEAETTAVKPTLTPAKPSMTKLTFFRLRDGFLQIQKLKIENKIDTLSKEIHEFKSELKNLLSDKINLSSSAKESFIVDVVKNVSKLLIKVSIYPTKDKCYGATIGSRITTRIYINKTKILRLTCICSCDLLNNFKPKSCRNNVEKEYHETKVKKFLKKINSQTGINYSDFKDNSYEEEESGNETEDEDDDV
ncbi:hypothetical protein GLOIN_2v1885941 [Rhizophagus irregularis DAOM 181602=DAOM 197198]|nr:hypothetical protein GLOIN_2v1885941 [Rhizophagus irregularis DAOM 181602=DAOM 197198]